MLCLVFLTIHIGHCRGKAGSRARVGNGNSFTLQFSLSADSLPDSALWVAAQYFENVCAEFSQSDPSCKNVFCTFLLSFVSDGGHEMAVVKD